MSVYCVSVTQVELPAPASTNGSSISSPLGARASMTAQVISWSRLYRTTRAACSSSNVTAVGPGRDCTEWCSGQSVRRQESEATDRDAGPQLRTRAMPARPNSRPEGGKRESGSVSQSTQRCHASSSLSWYKLWYESCNLLFLFFYWRRGRDSNPRWTFAHTHFPGVLLRPLGHLSKGAPKKSAENWR